MLVDFEVITQLPTLSSWENKGANSPRGPSADGRLRAPSGQGLPPSGLENSTVPVNNLIVSLLPREITHLTRI